VEFEILRGGRSSLRPVEVEEGMLLRVALRKAGYAPEGSAVFEGDRPLPLDVALRSSCRLVLIPTFSGG
jgi:sulfur carrier protein ThiS